MKVTLDHHEDIADHIRTFWFKPERVVSYSAGQYTELTVPHDQPDERGVKHWFTLSSSPSNKLLSITTKFAGDKSSTFKKALWKLKPGTSLHMADPMGDFVLPKDKSIPLVFVAGGIGVTPFHSMVQWLVDTKEKRDIQLIYGANYLGEVVFRPLFEEYGLTLTIVLKNPSASWQGAKGGLSASKILELAGKSQKKTFYLSGPEPMVEVFEKELLNNNVDKHRLVTDFFPGYTEI